MARLPRVVFPGYPHYVTQRGTTSRSVFEAPADYQIYLGWLKEYSIRYGVEVWAYCLMPNSVDLVCVPREAQALSRTFNTVHMRFVKYVHRHRFTRGGIWEARFKSCAMDEPSAREAMRRLETMPVRTGLVVKAEDYEWSSARAHVSGIMDPILSHPWPVASRIQDWRCYLSDRVDSVLSFQVFEGLKTGRPAGAAEFIRNLEVIAGRRLGIRPRGRPRKNKRNERV